MRIAVTNLRRLGISACFVAMCGSARVAFAQTNEAAATELFDVGRDLMKDGHYAEACPKLFASVQFDPKVGTLARLAECEEHLGQMVNAHAHWARALDIASAAHDRRVDHIRAELGRIDALVAKVNVQLTGEPPSGVTLSIDGLDMGSATFGLTLPIERAQHTIAVQAPGKRGWSTAIDATAGSVTTVTVPPLEDIPVAPLPPVPPTPVALASAAAPQQDRISHPFRVPGIVTASVGVAGMGASLLVTLLVAKKDLDNSNAQGCSAVLNTCTSPSAAQERQNAVNAGNVATGIFVGSAVLTAVGVTFALLPAKHDAAPTTGALRLHVGPGSLGLRGEF
jgi:hypothetical protein